MSIFIARDFGGMLCMFLTEPKFDKNYQGYKSPGESYKIIDSKLFPEIQEGECWEFPLDMQHGRKV